jgi:photosystem II stability/assembly factor-like uncharacterized protein
VRFADEQNGWAFERELWATHDGGEHWVQPTLPGDPAAHPYVQSLEIGGGVVHAAILAMTGVRILTSPITGDSWTESGVTMRLGAGPVAHAQLVLQGRAGWAIEVNRTVMGGARLSGGRWVAWEPPCEAVGGFAALAAATETSLVAVCDEGAWMGSNAGVHVYFSTDGGTTFRRVAAPLPTGSPSTIAISVSGAVVVGGTSSRTGVLLASVDRGATWTVVYEGAGAIVADELGFTTPSQGVAIAQGQPQQLLMTYDSGRHWTPVFSDEIH